MLGDAVGTESDGAQEDVVGMARKKMSLGSVETVVVRTAPVS